MAHAGLNGLQPHQKSGLGLLPGTVQFLLSGTMLGQVADDIPDGVQGLCLLLTACGGVDAQQAGVRMIGHIGIDGVAQAPLLPQFLEQAGGAAAPRMALSSNKAYRWSSR